MDEHNKAADNAETASNGAAPGGDLAARKAASAAATDLARVESPSLSPSLAPDDADAPVGKLARPVDDKRVVILPAAKSREEFTGFEEAGAASTATSRRSRSFRRLALPAISLMLAVACGAAAGAAGALSLGWLAPIFPQSASVQEVTNLPARIDRMRTDIAAVKASVDAVSRSDSAQFAKLSDRFDRMERGQTATTTKSDAAFSKDTPKETTGSIAVPSGTASPLPTPPAPVPQGAPATQPVIVPGWGVRDVYRGVALLQSRAGGMVEVEAGDMLPGLGRIDAIRRQDGHWVVITSRGMIMSMR